MSLMSTSSNSGSGKTYGCLADTHTIAAATIYYPGLGAQTDWPTEGSTAVTVAATTFHQRNDSYKHPSNGGDNHISWKMSEVQSSMD